MRRAAGFTLIELMISLALLALLATVAWPLAQLNARRDKEQELRHALRSIRNALDAYKLAGDEGRIVRKVDESGYPPSLDSLEQGVADAKDPEGKKIYFLRRVPRDPFHPDPQLPATQTWALRSYASAPDDPQPGEDVYDVHSSSADTGLNGVPYRAW